MNRQLIIFLAKLVLLFGLVIGSFYVVDPYFLDFRNKAVNSHAMLYEFESNSVEVAFLGNSHLQRGLDLRTIEARLKAQSSITYGSAINIAQIYYDLRELLSYQEPKLVVIEVWPLYSLRIACNDFIEDDELKLPNPNHVNHKRMGLVKLEEIEMSFNKYGWYNTFNAMRYHDNWTDQPALSKSMKLKTGFSAREAYLNGLEQINILSDVMVKGHRGFEIPRPLELSEDELVYLKKIIDLTAEENIDLLLTSIPVYKGFYERNKSGFQEVSMAINTFIEPYEHVRFYDLNEEVGGYDHTYIMSEPYLTYNQHLNYKGMVSATNAIGDFINSHYQLTASFESSEIEGAVYASARPESSPDMTGAIVKVGDSLLKKAKEKKRFYVRPSGSDLTIEGWMHLDETNMLGWRKVLILSRDENTNYVFRKGISPRKAPGLIKAKGEDYSHSGYRFKIDSKLLEPGSYNLYHGLEADGEIRIMDMRKTIVIE